MPVPVQQTILLRPLFRLLLSSPILLQEQERLLVLEPTGSPLESPLVPNKAHSMPVSRRQSFLLAPASLILLSIPKLPRFTLGFQVSGLNPPCCLGEPHLQLEGQERLSHQALAFSISRVRRRPTRLQEVRPLQEQEQSPLILEPTGEHCPRLKTLYRLQGTTTESPLQDALAGTKMTRLYKTKGHTTRTNLIRRMFSVRLRPIFREPQRPDPWV